MIRLPYSATGASPFFQPAASCKYRKKNASQVGGFFSRPKNAYAAKEKIGVCPERSNKSTVMGANIRL